MDIDELKKQWNAMELRIDRLEKENNRLMTNITNNRIVGLRGRLLARYRMMIILCVVSPAWIFFMDSLCDVSNFVKVCYVLFFVVMVITNGYVYHLIRKVDYIEMTIKDALVAATNVEIARRRMKIIGWILAVPLLAMLFSTFYEIGREELIYGAWIGLIVGFISGAIYEVNTRRLIRQMRQTLSDELGEDKNE